MGTLNVVTGRIEELLSVKRIYVGTKPLQNAISAAAMFL
jgi:hypothetical protein